MGIYTYHRSWVERTWLLGGWIWVMLVIYLSLTPKPPEAGFAQGDKLGHLAAYALLMFWFAQSCMDKPQRWRLAGALAVLGVALEFLQGWTGLRTFSQADMLANLCGVALGWLAAPPRSRNLLKLRAPAHR